MKLEKNNELISIDYVYNLLQIEIDRIKRGIKNTLNQININKKKNYIVMKQTIKKTTFNSRYK